MIEFEKYLTESLKEDTDSTAGMIKVSPIKVLRERITDPARDRAETVGVLDRIWAQREGFVKEVKNRLDAANFKILKFGEPYIFRRGISWVPSIGIEVSEHGAGVKLTAHWPCDFPLTTPTHLTAHTAAAVKEYVSDLPGNSRLAFDSHSSAAHGGSHGFSIRSGNAYLDCIFYFEKTSVDPNIHNHVSFSITPAMYISARELPILKKLHKYATLKEIGEAQQQMFELMLDFSYNLSSLKSTLDELDLVLTDLKNVDDVFVVAMDTEEFDI